MSLVRTLALCSAVALAAANPTGVFAQQAQNPVELAQSGGIVQEIRISGNQRIEAETVRSYIAIAEGDAFNAERIDRSLKNLFATGLFADVALRREGDALIVQVVENPIINRIAFEGNQRIKDDVLEQEVQLSPRVVYTRTKVQSDVQRVLEVYRRSGRFAATVEPKVIQLEQNRVDLVFEIDEGPATNVSRINVIGNRAFSDSRLRGVLQTKEERWYRFFSTDDTYDPDRLTFDRELLRRYYLSEGYVDFRVASVVAELTPDRESFVITYTIEEGEQYDVGQVAVDAQLKDLDPAQLEPLVLTEAGETYNAEETEQTIQALTETVGNLGYAFAEVRPIIDRNREEKTVDITYQIQEGSRVYVDRIEVVGNVRTLDKVIRREIPIVEGDAFNAAKIRRARQRLQNLGFFENVEISTAQAEDAPDRTIVTVDVEEKSTGELNFGAGWSTTAGILGEIGFRERNLLGKGQDLRASFSLGAKRTQFDISFTEPFFMDRPIAAGFDLFLTERKLQSESSYDFGTQGGALRVGYPINDVLRQDWKYGLRRNEINDIASNASRIIREQEGTTVISSLQQTLTWDTRDSRFDPTEGYMLRLNTEFAGIGGTEKFYRVNGSAAQHFELFDQVVLSLGLDGGFMDGISDEVIINERYFLGGDNMRGFAPSGIGPRDRDTGDALGGLWMYTGSVQVDFPFGLPEELGFTGRVFTDFGSIGPTEESSNTVVQQSSSIRATVGAGVRWISPVGPINVDFGYPIAAEDFDDTEVFRLNFGTRF